MTDEKTICPLKYLTNIFGGKWKMPILCILADNIPKRYSVIKRRLGNITNMMLTQSLKELESAGMVIRTQFKEVPPHVEYSLTEKGKSAIPMISGAAQWAIQDMSESGFVPSCRMCQTKDCI